eukprot:TRINITY_DN6486_c0_g1_i1.p1 TRINITY_DN6486_c0_g1~~TRINITY_DN6486_c0_g1_i1.p1  ORF type:complete len:673 (+),score=112.73 TRINITY_DN6486_c0_g1_i1:35-2053(+)
MRPCYMQVLTCMLLARSAADDGVSAFHAEMSSDGRFALVRFIRKGILMHYNMSAFSLYAGSGIGTFQPPEAASARSFRARQEENEHGLWATAVFTDSVTGLFQTGDEVLRMSLSGKDVQVRRLQDLVDAAGFPTSFGTWNGTKWWPGCYSGDAQLNEFKVGIVADISAYERHGESLTSLLETIIAEASFVYELQLNIKLTIGFLHMYKVSANAPAYAIGCSKLSQKLDEMKQNLALASHGIGAVHLVSGCDASGYGIGYEKSLCDKLGKNVAVSKLLSSLDWLTVAHELGHNFGAAHSFEEGQGITGGIMDYGNGLLDGTFQFNTKYRKEEVCAEIGSKIDHCDGAFTLASLASTTSTTKINVIQSCDFETSLCDWRSFGFGNDGWQRHSGPAPFYSSGVGPSGAASGDHYMLVRIDGNYEEYFMLQTSLLDLAAPVRLSFSYCMYGQPAGLSFQTTEDPFASCCWEEKWSEYGNEGDQWLRASVDIPQSVTGMRFNYLSGYSWKGDVAVDNIVAVALSTTSTTTTSSTTAALVATSTTIATATTTTSTSTSTTTTTTATSTTSTTDAAATTTTTTTTATAITTTIAADISTTSTPSATAAASDATSSNTAINSSADNSKDSVQNQVADGITSSTARVAAPFTSKTDSRFCTMVQDLLFAYCVGSTLSLLGS